LYKCPRCGTEVDQKSYMDNKCPNCRYRILFKNVPEVTRWVSASVPDGNMTNRVGLKK